MAYTIAVIGCGVIGRRLGNAFVTHDDLDLKYAVDINSERLSEYCEQFSCQGFDDYHKLLELDDVDIIYVGVPPKWHYQITMDALERGKHVICEKPISISAEYGRKMAAKATEMGRVTAVNFVFNHVASFQHMKELITGGKLGQVEQIEIRIRMPRWPRSWQDVEWLKDHDQGGPLREIGSHFIYATQNIFGPIQVTESRVELTAPGRYEREVQASFVTNNIPGKLDLITENDEDEENTLYITGTGGKIRFRNWHILEQWDEDAGLWTLIDQNSGNYNLLLATEFVSAIEDSGDLVSFEEASRVQAVVDEIFSSII